MTVHAPHPGAPAIDARAVSKFFGNRAVLHDVTFSVHRGERALLLGEPASGKTTLLKVLAGHVTPSGGRVRIGGVDGRTSRLALNDRIGFVGQVAAPDGRLSVVDALRFSGQARHMPQDVLEKRMSAVVELCELGGSSASPPSDAGVRVRTALALAILHSPAVLLLDGCFADLGARHWQTIVRILDRLADSRMTVVVSGRPDLRRRLAADRVLELEQGRLDPSLHAATQPTKAR